MPTPNELRNDFNSVVDENGIPITITNYPTITFGAGFDDEQLPSSSGTSTSGGCILQPIGAGDRQYVERGLVTWNDSKMFIAGSLPISGNSLITIGNTGSYYEVLPQGIIQYQVSGTLIYQTVYVRQTASGQHAGVTA